MSDVKLLPCPFCGGEIKLDEDDFICSAVIPAVQE